LKYREDNANGIKDAQQRIKENMKKIKEKLIQRINQVERELNNKKLYGVLCIQGIILHRIPYTSSGMFLLYYESGRGHNLSVCPL
jgi:hypothetical protein